MYTSYALHQHVKAPLAPAFSRYFTSPTQPTLVTFSVRHPVEEIDFRWKEDEPISIFNKELAEFDVTKFEVESKNSSYVSG